MAGTPAGSSPFGRSTPAVGPVFFAVLATAIAGAVVPLLLFSSDPAQGIALAASLFLCVLLFVCAIFRPIWFLGLSLVVWAPTLFLTKDVVFGNLGSLELRLSRVTGMILCVGLLVRVFIRLCSKQPFPRVPAPLAAYLVFAGYMLVPLILTPDPSQAFSDFVRFLSGLFCFLLIWLEAQRPADVAFLHRATLTGAFLSSAVTAYLGLTGTGQQLLGHGDVGQSVTRTFGALGGANVSGLVAVIGVALVVPWIHRHRGGFRLALLLGVVGVFALTVAVTLSRTAIIEFVLFALLWVSLDRTVLRRPTYKALLLATLALLLVGALYIKGFDQLSQRMKDVPGVGQTSLTSDSTGSYRILLWRGFLKTFVTAPASTKLLGQGLGSSFIIGRATTGLVAGPHNEYIWLITETGALGSTIYLVFLILTVLYFSKRIAVRSGATADSRQLLLSAFFCLFLAYSLAEEMFGWGITMIGTRYYVLAFYGLALAAERVGTPHLSRSPRQ